MSRIVYQEFEGLVVTADATQDVWSIIAGSGSPIYIHGWEMRSNAIVAAIIDCNFHRITAAGTGGAASSTEELADERMAAVTASVRTLDITTEGADGGGLMAYQWEQLGAIGHVWTPEMRPRAAATDGFAFSWHTATGATLSGWLCWEEEG